MLVSICRCRLSMIPLCATATVAGAARIEPPLSNPSNRSNIRLFLFTLAAHIPRLALRRCSSSVGQPFSAAHFFWALLQANSCVRQLRSFCFHGSSPHTHNMGPSYKAAARFGSRSPRFWVPQKNGAEKGDISMSYLNSVTIVGFVGADPEQRQARNNGSKFTVLS